MAETRSITITIKGGGGDNKPKPEQPKPENRKIRETIENKGIGAVGAILANQVYQNAVSMLKQTAQYEINKYFDTTNDYVSKRNLNEAITLVGLGSSLAMATVAGARVAGIAGATVGAGLYLGHQALNISLRLDAQRMELERNDAQLAFSRERAGYSLTADSRGENL